MFPRISYLLLWLCFFPSLLWAQQAQTIVVLGSSTAAGAGPKSPDSSWVNLFRKYEQGKNPRTEVINLAVGGYTSYHILPDTSGTPAGRPRPSKEHNISKALTLHPDVIIINMPSNDVSAGFTTAEYQRNLSAVADIARTHHITCYITTTQPRNTEPAKRKQLEQVRDYIIASYPETYINFWEGIGAADGTVEPKYDSGDGLHLNGLGHRLFFERVKARVKG
jgi:lysophospholipase L1-like esterase